MNACSRSNVNHEICRTHGVLVMLDHYESVAKVTKPFQCGDKLVIVTLMKSYRRLVKYIQHAHK